jgi:hypothetical protein
MNHDDILSAFREAVTTAPDLIYVAIGCGMAAHPYGSHSPQQYPPQVAEWPGRKVCILIDSHFEPAPLYVFRYLGFGLPDVRDDPIVQIGDTTFITIQRHWDWKNPADHEQIVALCQTAIHFPRTYMIVQDYTGEDPTPYYPIQTIGPRLVDKVLFDMTQGRFGGECFVDFGKVRIRRSPRTGGFLQPRFQPLAAFWQEMSPEALYEELERRYSIATYTVYPYYLELRGRLEPKPWRNADVLRTAMKPMLYTYGLSDASLNEDNLRAYLRAALLDFTAAIETPLDMYDIERIIDAPERESIPHVLGLAKKLMMESRAAPPSNAMETEFTPP